MKKQMHRLLAMALSLILVVGMLPGTALAAGETPNATFTGTDFYEGVLSNVADGMQYKVVSDAAYNKDWTAITSNDPITIKMNVGYIYVRYGADDTTKQTIYVTRQAAPTSLVPVAPTTTANDDGKITGTTAAMEYTTYTSFTASTTKDCMDGETTGLKPGTYYVRVKGATNLLPSWDKSVPITSFTAPAISGTVEITGTQKVGVQLTATITGGNSALGTYLYVWKCGDQVRLSDSSKYTVKAEDAGKVLTVIVTASDRSGELTATTGTIAKAEKTAPTNLVGEAPSVQGASDGYITGTNSEMEYSTSPSFEDPIKCEGSRIEGLVAGTYYVRYAETDGYLASPYVEVTVPESTVLPEPDPVFSATLSDIDFGTKPADYAYEAKNPVITNTGNQKLVYGVTYMKAELTGDAAAFVCGFNTSMGAINVGATSDSNLYVGLADDLAAGTYTATITLYYDRDADGTEYTWEALDTATVTVTVEEPIPEPDPVFSATLSDIDFGTKPADYAYEAKNPVITNTGDQKLSYGVTYMKAELTGDAAAFVYGFNTGMGAIDVGATSDSNLYVGLADDLAAGTYTATITLYYDRDADGTEYTWEALDTATVTVTIKAATSGELDDIPQTGDSADLLLWGALCMTSAFAVAVLSLLKKKRIF